LQFEEGMTMKKNEEASPSEDSAPISRRDLFVMTALATAGLATGSKLRNLRSLGVAQPGSTPALGEDDPSSAALSRSTIS
jgi:hypothetical protein